MDIESSVPEEVNETEVAVNSTDTYVELDDIEEDEVIEAPVPVNAAANVYIANDVLDDQQLVALKNEVCSSEFTRAQFEGTLATLTASASGGTVLKVAQGYFALGQYEEALSWFEKSGTSNVSKGIAQQRLGDFDGAIATFESIGLDAFDATLRVVDVLRESGRNEEAATKLESVARVGDIRAEYHYQAGHLHETNAAHEEAMSAFAKAIKLDASHARALFFLAYYTDLYGNDDEAIDLYKKCISLGSFGYLNAMMNLAVLYEDSGVYNKALMIIHQASEAYPNNVRVRLYRKDIESSVNMIFDEDLEAQNEQQSKIMEIPITDFELSVRSRNCLKRMNIRTIGCLMNVTEQELLAYKNFGETSLLEIKYILAQKGMRIGQMLEDRSSSIRRMSMDSDSEVEDNEEYRKNLSELNLSIRARKALQRMNLNTIGELVKCTEAELLGCKNFGMMSLTEIKEKLTERNLGLHKLDD